MIFLIRATRGTLQKSLGKIGQYVVKIASLQKIDTKTRTLVTESLEYFIPNIFVYEMAKLTTEIIKILNSWLKL